MLGTWQGIFANDVFVVLARAPRQLVDARYRSFPSHFRRIHSYVRSRELKRRPSTLYYVHLPKTGGTSAWDCLSRIFRSSVYFSDVNVFLANPPARNEYDLVGLHFSPWVLKDIVATRDLVAGMLREPTDRFISGVLHARRTGEDVETFTPSQKAMREMKLAEFLTTTYGSYEVQLQLIALGTSGTVSSGHLSDEAMLAHAVTFLERDDTIFAPSHQATQLMQQLAERLDTRCPGLRRLNANDPTERARHHREIRDALPVIEAKNASERELYAFACRQFAKRG